MAPDKISVETNTIYSEKGPYFLTFFFLTLFSMPVMAQESNSENLAEKPLYRDPVFDGAADPVVIWNPAEEKHFMFYTNRRATADTLPGVSWVH